MAVHIRKEGSWTSVEAASSDVRYAVWDHLEAVKGLRNPRHAFRRRFHKFNSSYSVLALTGVQIDYEVDDLPF